VDVTGYLTVRKKELQGKDKLTAEIADNVKAFNVNLQLSIKLKCVRAHLRLHRTILSTLNTTLFKIISFNYIIVRCIKFDKGVKDIK